MQFRIIHRTALIPIKARHQCFLAHDNWNDWYQYETNYILTYVDYEGIHHKIGEVKIGQFNMEIGQKSPSLPTTFEQLHPRFFSLGQDVTYYQELIACGENVSDSILSALNDMVRDNQLFERSLKERVTKLSILRYVTMATVRGQFWRILNGGNVLSEYNFTYFSPKEKQIKDRLELSFHVYPESYPPTNIHVLIGRNGVGKTYIINNMIRAIIQKSEKTRYGEFAFADKQSFANIVSVTFNAFDESISLPEKRDKTSNIQYCYVGLRRVTTESTQNQPPKSPEILRTELYNSIRACRSSGAKVKRWKTALEMLETDPIFKEAQVTNIAQRQIEDEYLKDEVYTLFKRLSSGHRIVLLTITKLVETVEERSLVLIDEPETHLHPPLLSAFIRALSDLVIHRNGVAIVATHSPVILQEVPSSCIWKLRRSGETTTAERLGMESFGENVGALTREVFGLEVIDSGFHRLLSETIKQEGSYEKTLLRFSNQLGAEAKAILKGMEETMSEED